MQLLMPVWSMYAKSCGSKIRRDAGQQPGGTAALQWAAPHADPAGCSLAAAAAVTATGVRDRVCIVESSYEEAAGTLMVWLVLLPSLAAGTTGQNAYS
jgi:hypothetical protein